MEEREMKAGITLKSLLNKYKRLGITDNAYELYKAEIDYINTFDRDSDEYIYGKRKAEDRLLKNSFVKTIDTRKNKFRKSYNTWKRRNEGSGLQDWVDNVEAINAFRDINDFFAELSSDDIKEMYALGKYNNLTAEETRERIERAYYENLDKGFTIGQLKSIIKREILS